MPATIDSVIQTFDTLRSDKAAEDSWNDGILELVLPRKAYINQETTGPGYDHHETRLYDVTAVESVQILAAGHASYICPPGEAWFAWAPPPRLKGNDVAENYFARCSEIAREQLSASNFYTEIHETFLDRCAVGTGLMFVREGRRNALQFDYMQVGTYSLAEDDEGQVDTMARSFNWTPEKIVQRFGFDNTGEKIQEAYEDPKQRHIALFEVCHLVQPRKVADPSKIDNANMPWESVYFFAKERIILEESGFQEFPALATRYLLWGQDHVYGTSPTRKALPSIQQLQFLQRMMDTMVEVMAFPRVLELAEQAGEVDLRAGGRTQVSQQFAAMGLPKEWATAGRPDVLDARITQKQEEVKSMYHVPLFQLWQSLDKQMTATEVAAREREKLLLFSPTFTRLISDMRPMMGRVFGILMRRGLFPPPPREVMQPAKDGFYIEEPEVVWQSKIALALKQLGMDGFDRMALRVQGIAQMDPDVIDNFDLDTAMRELSRSEGIPMEFLRSLEEVNAIREAKAEAAKAQQMVENAPKVAGAMKDAATAGPALSGLGV